MVMQFVRRQLTSLTRPRLLAALEARTDAPALVVAPAGWGKTTLLAQYAAAFSGPVGWLRLEPGDATGGRLAARIEAALPPYAPDTGTFDQKLLVIDDLHLIDDSAAQGLLLERSLDLGARNTRVIFGSRRLPEVNFLRHEFVDVTIVDGEQLRFRAWEVERLLRDVYQEPLPPDDVAALSRRVGGWAAGLALYHLSTRGRPLADRRRAVAALDGRSAWSRDYLVRNVLADLSPPLRAFLVRTCVFDVLSGTRCDELLGGTDGQSRLEELERGQAFTVTHDGGRTFVYHEVLRAHLRTTLREELGDAGARAWHSRAGQILATEGALLEAARCHARAGDWGNVHQLLDQAGATVAAQGLDQWSDVLPAWFIAEDPWLVLAEGQHRVNQGQLGGAVAALARAETMFAIEPARARCRTLRAAAAAWLPDAPPWRGHWTGWLREATRRHPLVVAAEAERLPGPGPLLVRVVALLLAGQCTEAGRLLTSIPVDDEATAAGLAVRLLRAGFVAVGTSDGGTSAVLGELGLEAERAHLPWFGRIARAMTVLAGDETGAKEAASVVEECDRMDDHWGAFLAAALGTLVRAAHGGPDVEETAALVTRARALDAGVLDAWAQALSALAAGRAGLPEAEVEARRAETLARSAGVPGARVLALCAAAATERSGPSRPVDGTGPVGSASRTGDVLYRSDLRWLAAQAGLPPQLVASWTAGDPGRRSSSPPVEARLTVHCFGRFRISIDGRELDWSPLRPRARSVARILAMYAGRAVHRDWLLDMLWPDADPTTATRSLHVSLSSLRRFFEENLPVDTGGRLLCREGDAYLLALPSDAYCDVAVFRQALERARRAGTGHTGGRLADLRTVLTAYGGELLPEDGPVEWVASEREKLRRQAADAAAELAEAELADPRSAPGRVEEAVTLAVRCVEIDPCHDLGWRLLIEAHRRAGNLAAAERARREYVTVLVSLGLDPTEVAPSVPTPVPAGSRPASYPGPPAPSEPPVTSGRRIPLPRSPRPVPSLHHGSNGPPT